MAALNDLNANTVTDLAEWIPEIWSKLVHEEAIAKQLWDNYIGSEGSGMPVIMKTELLNNPGDTIRISQLANLTGSGVTGESTLQGNEEKLTLREIVTQPEWARNAVAETHKAKVQINQDFREKARFVLGRWLGLEMDSSLWTAVQQTAAVGFKAQTIDVIYANDATSVNTIDASDTFGVETIRQAVNNLEVKNIDKVGGEDGYYVIFIHPYQKFNLIKDSEWLAANRELGEMNPIFTNILGVYGGAVIKTTTQCGRAQNANSPAVYYSRAVALGAEALCRGMGEEINWAEQITDYGFKRGIAIGAAWEDKVMNDEAICQIVTASVDSA
jgi:N4-gp56 family major capsid protein